MNIRRNITTLNDAERTAFVNAVLQLKNVVPSQLGLTNRYDDYVQSHLDSMMLPDGSDRVPGWAHRVPAFGPWHRFMLWSLEKDLQAVDPSVTLPYWDWTVDTSTTGLPWLDNFLGGDGNQTQNAQVMNGPFAFSTGNWTINVRDDQFNYLRREFRVNAASLPTPANVDGALTVTLTMLIRGIRARNPALEIDWKAGTERAQYTTACTYGWAAPCCS